MQRKAFRLSWRANSSIGLTFVRFWMKTALFPFQQSVQFNHEFIEPLLVLLFLNAFAELVHAFDFFRSHIASPFTRNPEVIVRTRYRRRRVVRIASDNGTIP